MARERTKGRFTQMGPGDVPDLARMFEQVAQNRAELPAFTVRHHPGLTLTATRATAPRSGEAVGPLRSRRVTR